MVNQFRLPAALLLSALLIGCGQSGPLYVTGQPSTAEPVAEPASSEAEDDSDTDNEAPR